MPPCRSVLILRPSAAALSTEREVRLRGLRPVLLSLSHIEKLSPAWEKIWENLAYTALLATSANAFAALPQAKALRDFIRALPLYCVGGKTAAAAKTAGFANIRFCADTAEDLCRFLRKEQQSKTPLPHKAKHEKAAAPLWLYLAGKPRRKVLEEFFQAEHIPCHSIEIYETAARVPTKEDLKILPPHLEYILLYSVGMASYIAHLQKHISAATQILCLSPRIKAAVPPHLQPQARSAAVPTEAALLALLPSN